jgi:hypothetical protein
MFSSKQFKVVSEKVHKYHTPVPLPCLDAITGYWAEETGSSHSMEKEGKAIRKTIGGDWVLNERDVERGRGVHKREGTNKGRERGVTE